MNLEPALAEGEQDAGTQTHTLRHPPTHSPTYPLTLSLFALSSMISLTLYQKREYSLAHTHATQVEYEMSRQYYHKTLASTSRLTMNLEPTLAEEEEEDQEGEETDSEGIIKIDLGNILHFIETE